MHSFFQAGDNMYKISVIASDARLTDAIASSVIWAERSDFEFAGALESEALAIEFLKETNSSMVLIDAAGRNPAEISVIDHIKRVLPEVYIVLISDDRSFNAVRSGFISGIFDYIPAPVNDDELREIFLRLYSDLGGRYIYTELNEAILPLIEAVSKGSTDVSPVCKKIVHKIYTHYHNAPLTAYMVSEKAKTYVYDELLHKTPWLRKFIFKYNFIHNTGKSAEDEKTVYAKWAEHFQAVADTVRKYSMLDNSLISNIGYYVVNHVDEHLSLENVSGGVFLNKSYISHIFKKISGISFVNFITDVKMDRAKILLMNPKLKIYEIAAQIGYNNPEYFSRVFKATTGITPNRYRSSLNIEECE